jgi:hypothetical protein
VALTVFSFFLRISVCFLIIYKKNSEFSFFRDLISILRCCISAIRGFKASCIAFWISAIRIAFGGLAKPTEKTPFWAFRLLLFGFHIFRGESSTSPNLNSKGLFVKTDLTVIGLVSC